MRYLVLSDLHGNLEALTACLERARTLGYDRSLVLGDLVGYGADPNAVLDAVRALPGLVVIRGNHDRVAAGLDEGEDFSAVARAAAHWTRRVLREDHRAFLAGLPRGPVEFAPGALLAHGSPLDEDAYLLDEADILECFEEVGFDLCFFGHTHWPCAFSLANETLGLIDLAQDGARLDLAPGARYLVNPGSVGQPRDRSPLLAFAIYDDRAGTVTLHRVAYPAEKTRRRILEAGLPEFLGDRLLRGV